jgi:CBS-domain-containing membrane protein
MNTTVGEVMTCQVIAAREEADFKEIAAVMRHGRVSALPVLDSENRVIGVVSESDLLAKEAAADGQHAVRYWAHRAEERKASAVLARDLMTRPAVTIGRDATAVEAARTMRARRVKRLVVTDETGHLLGIVSRIDVLSVYDREDDDIRDEIVNDIIIGDCALNPDAFVVLVRCGIVTITGQAESRAVAVQLLEAIRHVEAVVDVRDRLSYRSDDAARKAKIVAFNLFTPRGESHV